MSSPSDSSARAACARLCVSALSGGGGKTLLSLGLARAFARRGVTVKPFKKGPDYIDAAWLGMAARQTAVNLDPHVLAPDGLRALFAHSLREAGVHAPLLALVEGNRGLFDGLDVAGSCSTAALARTLGCPLVLALDCTKMTRTAAALVRGVLAFEPDLTFAGLVLNQVGSARHESLLRRVLEEYTDLPVLGALPRMERNPLPERHMGIATSGDRITPELDRLLEELGDFVEGHVDMPSVLEAAFRAPPLFETPSFWPDDAPKDPGTRPEALYSGVGRRFVRRPRIGYVRDSAFWFYYPENLEALARSGAELVELALVGAAAGESPPECPPPASGAASSWVWPGAGELHGLYLGGGFPEDWGRALSASPAMRLLARWAGEGMPIYAECGGFLLLARVMESAGAQWPMSGVFPVRAEFQDRPQGLGYVRAVVTADNPWFPRGMELLGHEFHYSRCLWEKTPPPHALSLSRGRGMGRHPADAARCFDGLLYKNVWASYMHIFAPAIPCWARNFVDLAQNFAEREGA